MSLSALIGDLNTKFGTTNKKRTSTVAMFSDEQRAFPYPRIPIGVFTADYCTGGGIPVGVVTRVFGVESSGKSSLCLKVAANAQRTCRVCYRSLDDLRHKDHCERQDGMNVFWLDVEGSYAHFWSVNFGVDPKKMAIMRPEYAEQVVDAGDAILRDPDVDLMIVDSVAAMTPMVEIEESAEKNQMGVGARLMNRALRRWNAALAYRDNLNGSQRPTIILINQIREKIGVLYGSPHTTPMGMGQRFVSHLDIKMRPGKVEFHKEEKEKPTRVQIFFNCPKNKTAPPKMSGDFWFWLNDLDGHTPGDTEEEKQLIPYLEKYGMLTTKGEGPKKVWIIKTGDGQNDSEFTREKDMMEMLRDTSFRHTIRELLLDKALKRTPDAAKAV